LLVVIGWEETRTGLGKLVDRSQRQNTPEVGRQVDKKGGVTEKPTRQRGSGSEEKKKSVGANRR